MSTQLGEKRKGAGGENAEEDVQTESGSAWAENRALSSLVDILPSRKDCDTRVLRSSGARAENTAGGARARTRERKQILRNRGRPLSRGSSAARLRRLRRL